MKQISFYKSIEVNHVILNVVGLLPPIIFSEVGYWAVGRDVLVNDCLLSTTRVGLWFPNNEIQWMYDDGNNGWAKDDPTIRINL